VVDFGTDDIDRTGFIGEFMVYGCVKGVGPVEEVETRRGWYQKFEFDMDITENVRYPKNVRVESFALELPPWQVLVVPGAVLQVCGECMTHTAASGNVFVRLKALWAGPCSREDLGEPGWRRGGRWRSGPGSGGDRREDPRRLMPW